MWLGGCTQASECAAAEATAVCCKPCWVALWRCDGRTVLACSQGAFGEAVRTFLQGRGVVRAAGALG